MMKANIQSGGGREMKAGACFPGLAAILAGLLGFAQAIDAREDESERVVDAREDQGERVIDEIVVTAQKRPANIIDVPIAISVLNANDIAQTSAFELSQITEYIPNVFSRRDTDFHARIAIRGVGAQTRNIGFDSRVGLYLDGVYLGPSPAVNQDLVDLERVEVLRGPQGTLFGKNSVAGAIALVSEKPGPEPAFNASAGAFNYDGLELKADANIPLGDRVAMRVYVSKRKRDGYFRNIIDASHVPSTINVVDPDAGPILGVPLCDVLGGSTPPGCIGGPVGPDELPPKGQDLNTEDVESYRAQLRARVGESWTLDFSVDGLDGFRDFILGEPLTDTFGSTIDRVAPERWEVSVSKPGIQDRDLFGASATAEYVSDAGYRIKSISAYRDTDIVYVNDSDLSALDIDGSGALGGVSNRYEQVSQEIQLISPESRGVRYVAGLYYYGQDAATRFEVPIGNAGWLLGVMPGDGFFTEGTVETESVAGYVTGEFDLDKRWQLGLGLRFTRETKDVVYHQDTTGIPPGFGVGTTPPEGYVDSRSDKDLSPSVDLSYMTGGGTNIYARYARGFKSGGFNVDIVSQDSLDTSLAFKPETVDSYELGFKGHFLGNRLYMSGAAFMAFYDDYQVNQFFDLGFDPEVGSQVTSIRITNAAKVETRGLELEGKFRVTENWDITGFVGLLDATFERFPGGTSMAVEDPEFPGGIRRVPVSAAGNELPEAPDITAGLGFQYRRPIGVLDAFLSGRLDILYTGDYFTTVENERTRVLTGTHPLTFAFDINSFGVRREIQFGHVDATTILNGRIGLVDGGGKWDVYLWGRNLTDEDEFIGYGRDFPGGLWGVPRPPRMYGVEVAFHF